MIDFLRALRAHAAYGQRMLSFIPALFIAEMFYKFGSFLLECVAFLATWLVLDLLTEWVAGKPAFKVTDRASREIAGGRH